MHNLIDPAILFFVFGAFAGAVRSNLEVPPQIAKFLSLYLLMALGLKGGFALSQSGFTSQVLVTLMCAVGLAVLTPYVGFKILKRLTSRYNAAAIAATYGSVSAVTFITAVQYAESHGIAYGGHMAAAMALMESPAIIMAVLFANQFRAPSHMGPTVTVETGVASGAAPASAAHGKVSLGKILHESFTEGAQLLLLGAIVVGLITGEAGKAAMKPFSGDLFKGMLSFFLLDMGLMAARNLPSRGNQSPWVFAYAVIAPVAHAFIALGVSVLFRIPAGDAGLLMTLAASASYIAVPAVLRYAIPEAQPSVYFGMALGITFPINIVLGIPAYLELAQRILG
ncbi:MAG: sodium-dependent bicarbonate transport family permease [Verrucomicrobia bacterium]|nr:sodium-dependent bicarbonate transport family permease [Verrucomicrobiota bacterium]